MCTTYKYVPTFAVRETASLGQQMYITCGYELLSVRELRPELVFPPQNIIIISTKMIISRLFNPDPKWQTDIFFLDIFRDPVNSRDLKKYIIYLSIETRGARIFHS